MLCVLGAALLQPALGHPVERNNKVLSSYLLDTEFLEECALKHRKAFEKSLLFSGEIRSALLGTPPCFNWDSSNWNDSRAQTAE